MSDKHTRRELLKPVQLLGLAFGAALFAGVVTLVSMGFFQDSRPVDPGELTTQGRALVTALVVTGIIFIVVLVGTALMILAVDPAQVHKQIDRPVLLPPEDAEPDGGAPEASGPSTGPEES